LPGHPILASKIQPKHIWHYLKFRLLLLTVCAAAAAAAACWLICSLRDMQLQSLQPTYINQQTSMKGSHDRMSLTELGLGHARLTTSSRVDATSHGIYAA